MIKQIRIVSHSYKSSLNLIFNYLIINTLFSGFGVRVRVSVRVRIRVSVRARVRVRVSFKVRIRA